MDIRARNNLEDDNLAQERGKRSEERERRSYSSELPSLLLPYYDARMTVREQQSIIDYWSIRTHRGAPFATGNYGWRVLRCAACSVRSQAGAQ